MGLRSACWFICILLVHGCVVVVTVAGGVVVVVRWCVICSLCWHILHTGGVVCQSVALSHVLIQETAATVVRVPHPVSALIRGTGTMCGFIYSKLCLSLLGRTSKWMEIYSTSISS